MTTPTPADLGWAGAATPTTAEESDEITNDSDLSTDDEDDGWTPVIPMHTAMGSDFYIERRVEQLTNDLLDGNFDLTEDAAWCLAKDKYEKELQFDTDYMKHDPILAEVIVALDVAANADDKATADRFLAELSHLLAKPELRTRGMPGADRGGC